MIFEDAALARSVRDSILQDVAPGNSWTVARREEIPWTHRFEGGSKAWPFRHTECFELKAGEEPVPLDDPEFYRRYRSVGPFPQVAEGTREVEIKLLQTFGVPIRPLV
jgi:hypothetical protein